MYEPILTFLQEVFRLMYTILTEDIQTFAPDAYDVLTILSSSLVGVGLAISLTSFLIAETDATVTMVENKSVVGILKLLLKLGIVFYLVTHSVEGILLPAFSMVRLLIAQMFSAVGMGPDSDYLQALTGYFDASAANPFEWSLNTMFSFNIYTLIFSIAAVISGVVLLLTVIGRFLKIYVYMCYAPVALAFFSGGPNISRYGQSYLTNMLSVVAGGLTISVCIIFFQAIVRDAALMQRVEELFSFLGEMAKPGLVVLFLGSLGAMIKGADTLTHRLLGFS